MKHIEIVKLFQSPEEFWYKKVTVCGWVRTSSEVKTIAFIQLNDGSVSLDNLQLTIKQDKFTQDDYINKIRPAFSVGTSLVAEGIIVPSDRNLIELEVNRLEILGMCPSNYPLQKKKTSVEFLRTIPHLRTRTNLFKAVFTTRARLAYAIHSYFSDRGYKYLHAPIITKSDCEGAGEMFRITTQPWDGKWKDEAEYFHSDYFSCKAGLAVSCQLEGEMAALGGLGKVYTFGPSFRAEHSNTTRHVAEFWHVEPEVCFADLNEIIEIAEEFIKYALADILENCAVELQFLDKYLESGLLNKLQNVVNSDFARIDYTSAVNTLQNCGQEFAYPIAWGMDLQTEHEKYLAEVIFKRPVFLTDFPKDIKAFYMKQNPDEKTVAATDLLVPGIGEIIGCSERESDFDKLVSAMVSRNMPLEEYQNYLDTRRYGSVQHSGFGLGFDRLVMYVTGISNIRDVLQFPRTYEHVF